MLALVPYWWNKGLKESMKLASFNARVETVTTKPFFREPFQKARRAAKLTCAATAYPILARLFCCRRVASAGSVGRLRCRSCVIDGEVVIEDELGRAVFERLQNGPRIKPEAVLFAFDLIELDGQDLRREPLLIRKKTLLSLIKGAPAGIRYNEHLKGEGDVIFRHACKLGCEGIVSKRVDSPYRSGRSRDWIKTKSPAAIEAQKVRSENWNK